MHFTLSPQVATKIKQRHQSMEKDRNEKEASASMGFRKPSFTQAGLHVLNNSFGGNRQTPGLGQQLQYAPEARPIQPMDIGRDIETRRVLPNRDVINNFHARNQQDQ